MQISALGGSKTALPINSTKVVESFTSIMGHWESYSLGYEYVPPNGYQLSEIVTPDCHPRWKIFGPFQGLWGQVSRHKKHAHLSVSP